MRASNRVRSSSTTKSVSKASIIFPQDSERYQIEEEIGSGSFGTIYRGRVRALSLEKLNEFAEKKRIKKSVVSQVEQNFRDDPRKLFTVSSEDRHLISPTSPTRGHIKRQLHTVLSAAKTDAMDVAIKIVSASDTDCRKMQNEVEAMKALQHQNIMNIYSAFMNEEGGWLSELWIVMPLQECSCLEVLESLGRGIKDAPALATILFKVASALAYIHKKHKMHRDIKAANVLLSKEGEVKLSDFGMACNLENKTSRTFVGTYYWMAPEVIARMAYDTRADVWSFGILAMELAYGQPPYALEPPLNALVKTIKKNPPSCKLYKDYNKPKFPKEYHSMISKCLKKKPSRRLDMDKVLTHSFFKIARDAKYLKRTLLEPMRQKERVPESPNSCAACGESRTEYDSKCKADMPSPSDKIYKRASADLNLARYQEYSRDANGYVVRRLGRFLVRSSSSPVHRKSSSMPPTPRSNIPENPLITKRGRFTVYSSKCSMFKTSKSSLKTTTNTDLSSNYTDDGERTVYR